MKVFLDTNVLVSAFTTRGLCADLLRRVLAEHELVTGEVVLRELRDVLLVRFRMPKVEVDGIEAFLRGFVVAPEPAAPHAVPIRDPDDGWVLASAVAAAADVLVTGDAELLVVADQVELRVMSPRQFWNSVVA